MRDVNCPNCNRKLGQIDEENCSIIFEKDVEPSEPNASMGLIVVPYTCPDCEKTHMQIIVVSSPCK